MQRATRFALILCLALFAAATPTNSPAAQTISKKVYDRIQRAQAMVDAHDYEGALDLLQTLNALASLSDYERVNVLNYIGFVYYNMEDIPNAIRTYEQLLLQPGLEAAMKNQTTRTVAQLYSMEERYSEALDKLDEWFQLETDPPPDVFVFYAQVLYNLGSYDRMPSYLETAISLAEGSGQASKQDWWVLLQFALDKANKIDERAAVYEGIVQRWPTESNQTRAIVAYFDANDANRVVAGMEQILSEFPENEAVTPIHLAAARGDNGEIEKLVASGVPVDEASSVGFTALNIAARLGHVTTVQALLKLGANVDGEGNRDSTPILHAASGRQFDIIERLLAEGADPTICGEDSSGLLPHIAQVGDADLIRRLGNEYPKLLEIGGAVALAQAASNGHADAFRALLDLGVQPVEEADRSTLATAVMGGDLGIVLALVENGTDIHASAGQWQNALYAAAYYGQPQLVSWLLENGVKPNANPGDGDSALKRAVMGGNADVVTLLLEAGVDPDEESAVGGSPLAGAIIDRQTDIAKILIAAGADIDNIHFEDFDALGLAVEVVNPDVVAALVENGAKPRGELAKLAKWRRTDIRKFLQAADFERVPSAQEETWSLARRYGAARTVVLAGDAKRFSLPELIRIVEQSKLPMRRWLEAT